MTHWNVHRTRAYDSVAELYWGVLGLPLPESSRSQRRAYPFLFGLHCDFWPFLLSGFSHQQSLRRDAFPLEEPGLSVYAAFDARVGMPPDRLHTGDLRNNARIDNVVLCQSRKILTEMHARTILLVQMIRPARIQREWVIERVALRLRPNPPAAQQHDPRSHKFHRRSISFGARACRDVLQVTRCVRALVRNDDSWARRATPHITQIGAHFLSFETRDRAGKNKGMGGRLAVREL